MCTQTIQIIDFALLACFMSLAKFREKKKEIQKLRFSHNGINDHDKKCFSTILFSFDELIFSELSKSNAIN